ncbi:uncharacterized protein LOC132285752 [Cornus florida]|uniref:uncharacterized protein LOC132285752 n=1 Tax=Cornus florida TaxID=4283 RepID=UPI00289DACA5|nr:uncharacterized protein LOC132285752 [Cornus florida]XP_059643933.1 uncharacterized protein LOC132285752 [Cornus florida]
MPTYTAIALDRLFEPGASKSIQAAKNAPHSKLERRNNAPNLNPENRMSAPNSTLERRNSTSMVTTINHKHHWARMSPALYATPEPTPLPDSPTSFPPSPYIINHKRRGPRLLKSFSEVGVATCKQAVDERDVSEKVNNPEKEVADKTKDVTFTVAVPSPVEEEHVNGSYDGVLGRSDLALTSAKSNTEAESNNGVGVEQSLNLTPPIPEFFDAWEELSSENGPQASLPDVEEELREIRLSLVLEIEKRKQAEETLKYMQSRWLRIREQLSLVGLTLADPIDVVENEKLQVDPAEDLSQQVHIARFVSNIIGRGTAKAEVEMEMEAHIESKNFEIARLWDRLHYYEAVNQEMSHRNQESIEMTRHLRQQRKKRQRWVWGSVSAAITLGTATLAWSSYQSTVNGSSSYHDHATK